MALPFRGGMVVQPQKGTFHIPESRKHSLKFFRNRLLISLLFISFYGRFKIFAEKATFYFFLVN